MIFDLAEDFAAALAAMPGGHPRRYVLSVLDRAIRRDVHFIDRHPTTLFQCMWNTCWWHDCAEAAAHYESVGEAGGEAAPPAPPATPAPQGLRAHELMERWRARKERHVPGFWWARSLRPLPSVATGFVTTLTGHTFHPEAVAWSRDGSLVISGAWDGTIRLWDAATGRTRSVLEAGAGCVYGLATCPGDDRLAVAHQDTSIVIWDVRDAVERVRLHGHTKAVRSVAFSPDGKHLVSGGDDGTCRRWSLPEGPEATSLDAHDGAVYAVAFARDGAVYASGGLDRRIVLWSAADDTQLACLEMDDQVWALEFDPSGRTLAAAVGNSIEMIRIDERVVVRSLSGHERPVRDLDFSPDGTLLATGSEDETVRIWDLAGGRELARFREHQYYVAGVAFSPEANRLASASYDGSVHVYHVPGDRSPPRLSGHRDKVLQVHVSAPGARVISGGEDRTVRVWHPRSGRLLRTLETSAGVTSVTFASSGEFFASAEGDGIVRVWDAHDLRPLAVLQVDLEHVYGRLFGTDLRYVDVLGFALMNSGLGFGLLGGTGYGAWQWSSGEPLDEERAQAVVGTVLREQGERWETGFSESDTETAFRLPGSTELPRAAELREAMARGEPIVRPTADVVTWFPARLGCLSSNRDGRLWAGARASHVYMIALEPWASGEDEGARERTQPVTGTRRRT